MEVEGALVTIDAMGCQKEIAKKIVKEKGVSTAHGSNLRMIDPCLARGSHAQFLPVLGITIPAQNLKSLPKNSIAKLNTNNPPTPSIDQPPKTVTNNPDQFLYF